MKNKMRKTLSTLLLTVIGLGLIYPDYARASEMELCLSSEVPTPHYSHLQNWDQWQAEQALYLYTAEGLQCKDIEEFRDTISGTITGIAFVGIPIIHYVPHIYVKLLVGGTIGSLQYLSLYIKDLPCEKDEKNMQQELTQAVCLMAQSSDGIVKCKTYNSSYVLPLDWENGLSYKNLCQKINNMERI